MVANLKRRVLEAKLEQRFLHLPLIADIFFVSFSADEVKRRLSDEDVSTQQQGFHVAEEEGQQQRANVRPIDICIGHDDHFVVSPFFEIELIVADAHPERADDRLQVAVGEYFVQPRLFDVQNLASQR